MKTLCEHWYSARVGVVIEPMAIGAGALAKVSLPASGTEDKYSRWLPDYGYFQRSAIHYHANSLLIPLVLKCHGTSLLGSVACW